jgi:peptidylprolyl isomerase
MVQAKHGDTVKVHYTGKLEDGMVFDSSLEREPVEFTIGERHLIAGFENAVVGMEAGESKTIEILSEQAYGPYREDRVVVIERDEFPKHIVPRAGQRLQIRQPNGPTFDVMVTAVSELSVTLDANHPLAGRDLTFEIQLVEII